jgi:hypothetical protein
VYSVALGPISESETADALASGLQTTHPPTHAHARAHTHTDRHGHKHRHTDSDSDSDVRARKHTHTLHTHTGAEAAPLVPQLPRVKV